eukprot:TRINITY_DN4187_c0_g1_i1.p1 TRINITY_DN4187_c0_g1~~TRINITY_DN4187_c0_g1_i1.p1  ORF type:complete len:394 (-),score=58.02 TRINITY_DN4187_c0_g1_i1:5-1186(-)
MGDANYENQVNTLKSLIEQGSTNADAFLQVGNHLRLSTDEERRIGGTISTVDAYFRNSNTFAVVDVVIGGSYGKGTALTGHHDLDVIVFIHETSPPESSLKGYKDATLDDLVMSCKNLALKVRKSRYTATGEVIKKLKAVSLKITDLKVDILLAPQFADKHSLYRHLLSLPPRKRNLLSAATCRIQKSFFDRVIPDPAQRDTLRAATRLAKLWRNIQSLPHKVNPGSYLIELLTLHAYQLSSLSSSSHNPPSVYQIFVEFLLVILSHSTLSVTWEEEYNVSPDYPRMSDQRPLVRDPANPFNNVAHRRCVADWGPVAERALLTLVHMNLHPDFIPRTTAATNTTTTSNRHDDDDDDDEDYLFRLVDEMASNNIDDDEDDIDIAVDYEYDYDDY